MKPDARLHNPDPRYLRELVDRIADPELMDTLHKPPRPSQRKIAERLGIQDRTFRRYLKTDQDGAPTPYAVQFCLEALANFRRETPQD